MQQSIKRFPSPSPTSVIKMKLHEQGRREGRWTGSPNERPNSSITSASSRVRSQQPLATTNLDNIARSRNKREAHQTKHKQSPPDAVTLRSVRHVRCSVPFPGPTYVRVHLGGGDRVGRGPWGSPKRTARHEAMHPAVRGATHALLLHPGGSACLANNTTYSGHR